MKRFNLQRMTAFISKKVNRMTPDEVFLFYSVLCLYNTVSVITKQSYTAFFGVIYAKIGVIP
jgi:hypothetical protein